MGDPYTSQTITGYNTNPPPDDGTQSADNEITWAKHKDKLGDPLKTLAEAINTEVSSAFGKVMGGAGLTNVTTNTTLTSSNQSETIRINGQGVTLTTPDATTVGSPFVFTILTDLTDGLILDGNGSQTVNGSATITIPSNTSVIVFTDGSNWFAQYSGMPVGTIQMYGPAFGSEPTGWLALDGRAVSRTTYSALFSAVGTTYGSGDGSTTFNLPDMRGKSPVGTNRTGLPDDGDSNFSTRNEGDTGGAEEHTLSISEMPSHTHDYIQPDPLTNEMGTGSTAVSRTRSGSGVVTSATGGGGAHNNMPPFFVLNFIIKT